MIYVVQNPNKDKPQKKPNQDETIHRSFAFLTKLGNCLGALPVSGNSPNELTFDWKSWKSFYSYLMIGIFAANSTICVVSWTLSRFSFRYLAAQMHQINALASLILYLRLAQKWPKLARRWNEVDRRMNLGYGYPKNLHKRIVIAVVVIIAGALGEYSLLVAYQIKNTMMEDHFNLRSYYLAAFPEFFSAVPFNGPMATMATMTGLLGHVIWSYNDLFIISISSALALRFKQITDRLLSLNEKKASSNEYWIELRADYDRLVHLSTKLEKYVSYIVLLSYSANVFFLLLQMSNVIGNLTHKIQVSYYSYSFSFLIARLVAVSLYGAWISEESKEPASCLNSVSSSTYNLEIRRLLLQISFNDVALTGSKMFKVTRGLLLSVAGAIVTYELVMIQFSASMGSD